MGAQSHCCMCLGPCEGGTQYCATCFVQLLVLVVAPPFLPSLPLCPPPHARCPLRTSSTAWHKQAGRAAGSRGGAEQDLQRAPRHSIFIF